MRRLANVEMRLLQIFATIVDCNGLSNAQAALNIAPSTLSGHLAALEARLGSKLCERGRGGFRLTAEGEETYRAAQALFRAVEGFEAAMRRTHGRARGRLRLGAIDTLADSPAVNLPAALAAFCAARPDVFLDVEILQADALLAAVQEGRRDLVIGPAPHKPAALAYVALPVEKHRLYCGRAHPWFARPDAEIAQADLARAPFSVRAYRYFDDTYRLGGAAPAASVSNMEAQEILILSGRFIGYLPEHAGERRAAQGLMRAIRPNDWTMTSAFFAIWDDARGPLADKRAFARCLKAAAKQPETP